jgi:hypothetical protein
MSKTGLKATTSGSKRAWRFETASSGAAFQPGVDLCRLPEQGMKSRLANTGTIVATIVALPLLSLAQDEAELARKAENPLADLITVPFQHNWDFGIGPLNAMKYTLKLQPIIPFPLGSNWVLLSRTILPITDVEASTTNGHDKFGLGDTSLSLFLSPRRFRPGGLYWGVGPAFQVPTATDDSLGDGQWGAGPTLAVAEQQGGWSSYILTRHIWSFAGDRIGPSVSETLVQPSLSYTFKSLTTLGVVSEATYDWQARQWTVPVNLTVSQLIEIGRAPLKLTLGGRVYAEGPPGGPGWGLRFTMTFLIPNGPKPSCPD